jgi:hypothetical protein
LLDIEELWREKHCNMVEPNGYLQRKAATAAAAAAAMLPLRRTTFSHPHRFQSPTTPEMNQKMWERTSLEKLYCISVMQSSSGWRGCWPFVFFPTTLRGHRPTGAPSRNQSKS